MDQGVQPFCQHCLVPLTVIHFIAECPSFMDIRLRLYPLIQNMTYQETMRHILEEKPDQKFDMENLISYLREINMYDKIV